MNRFRLLLGLVAALTATLAAVLIGSPSVAAAPAAPAAAPPATTARPHQPVGTVLQVGPLPRRLWVPGTRRAFRLTYVTTDASHHRATSTGTVFVPPGRAPRGGWPVIAWAHGTSGIGDGCAPSRIGPAEPARDFAYLERWLGQGYAIVASDYVGLGTPGLHPYLDADVTAHSVVDMVTAARNLSADRLPPAQRLSRRWVVLGQSQGGGAAIATAARATELGGRALDFRGGVGTGTPAYIEVLVSALGPAVPPVDVSPNLTTYVSYILAGMESVHPELGIDDALTPTGRRFVRLARTRCVEDLADVVKGTAIGAMFAQPLATVPGFTQTARDYLGMPESGFEKPIFMANGLLDTDVPAETTAAYVAVLRANGTDVTFKTYPTDHNGTMAASLPDSLPFVRTLFRR